MVAHTFIFQLGYPISGLFGVASNSSDPENGKFFSTGRMASRDLPLSRMDGRTNKCKTRITIYDAMQVQHATVVDGAEKVQDACTLNVHE